MLLLLSQEHLVPPVISLQVTAKLVQTEKGPRFVLSGLSEVEVKQSQVKEIQEQVVTQLYQQQVVARALQLKKDATVKDALPATCIEQIDASLELVQDYQQGAQLSCLSGDVDVARFTSDPQYKEDTILGLAMFTEKENWQFTLSLANR